MYFLTTGSKISDPNSVIGAAFKISKSSKLNLTVSVLFYQMLSLSILARPFAAGGMVLSNC